mmetsp:Transcript_22594/g.55723  ORF Transcript_22594/g.55723 Transcript_22594/m.55723 type:complete len:261 (+) Transcript_22594:125-907(+)|eukprot:CAMPEP_0206233964 /NCGR_PEP_ID=MMETSP0047_2-20121206/12311_1 /ASSEMBLY_ACC=CAM_ASM_000192 /TAXON_ID=195065 /ORGANISM="Chroomonas mesostigmatica_cf, Strain CCMP1168" /LENGTH=260 /DNA_ID=CAMNT_0053657965 /DNA_START=127 /DNA_END=909 /DNA_ORIENTATION=+
MRRAATTFTVGIFATLAAQTNAFFAPTPFLLRPLAGLRPGTAALRPMSSQSRVSMGVGIPINISGNNIDVTPALKNYVNDKMGKALAKVGGRVTKCEVHLVHDKNPAVPEPNHVEVTLFAKGAMIRASKNTPDMYATIDEVSDTIKRKLRKYKERAIDSHRQGKPEAADLSDDLIADYEAFNAEVAEQMTKEAIPDVPSPDMSKIQRKSFSMEPITLEEAVLCLEYIDNDFYVFKNKENNKVQVIYNRKRGGVGLIEPEA